VDFSSCAGVRQRTYIERLSTTHTWKVTWPPCWYY